MFFFRKKVKKEFKDTKSSFPIVEDLELKPYDSLKYDLVYAHNEILVDNDDVVIATRLYKHTLLKFMLVHDFTKMKNYSLDTDKLKTYLNEKGYLEYIKEEDLNTDKSVEIYIFKETSEEIKRYCFLNSLATRDLYRQYFTYDHEDGKILNYRRLRDFGPLVEQYLTSLYFDLACVDKEMY